MGFAYLLSRIISGQALYLSYYDEQFVVASVDRIWNKFSNRDCFNPVYINSVDRPSLVVNTITFINSYIPSVVESSSNLIGQDSHSSFLATFNVKIIAAIISCIAQSKKFAKVFITEQKNVLQNAYVKTILISII